MGDCSRNWLRLCRSISVGVLTAVISALLIPRATLADQFSSEFSRRFDASLILPFGVIKRTGQVLEQVRSLRLDDRHQILLVNGSIACTSQGAEREYQSNDSSKAVVELSGSVDLSTDSNGGPLFEFLFGLSPADRKAITSYNYKFSALPLKHPDSDRLAAELNALPRACLMRIIGTKNGRLIVSTVSGQLEFVLFVDSKQAEELARKIQLALNANGQIFGVSRKGTSQIHVLNRAPIVVGGNVDFLEDYLDDSAVNTGREQRKKN